MKTHIIANYAQKFLNIFLRFFIIPIYIDSLGMSSYGLIGFYISLSSMMVLLDFGMGYGATKLLAESEENKLVSLKA